MSVTHISGQLFWHLLMKIYQIWWLLAQDIPPKSLGSFFYGTSREKGFCWLGFLKVKKSILSNMVMLHIIGMQMLYWFENTKEPMSKNQYLSQYVVGLPSKISWFIKRGKDMSGQIRIHPSLVRQFWLFTEYLLPILCKRDLNDLHSYNTILGREV